MEACWTEHFVFFEYNTFRGSQVSSFDFSTLYTSLQHDLIKAKVLSLVNWCFNRESKTYLCTSAKACQGFLATRNMTRINVGLVRSYVKLLLSSWNTFDGMVYQQIVGIPMGTNCDPLIADLILYCYERDFMSDLQKSKRFDLIDMFNDTSRYEGHSETNAMPTISWQKREFLPKLIALLFQTILLIYVQAIKINLT